MTTMKARDEWPADLVFYDEMCDEIDRLRATVVVHEGLDGETIEFAIRAADNFMEERVGPKRFDDDGPIGNIARWNRDHPEET